MSSPENEKQGELTPEQYEAGAEIADLCGFSEDVLGQTMIWNGREATVSYGLAHSAHHMDILTVEEIQKAVFGGIAEYQGAQTIPSGPQ
jgi:hypothetical protein